MPQEVGSIKTEATIIVGVKAYVVGVLKQASYLSPKQSEATNCYWSAQTNVIPISKPIHIGELLHVQKSESCPFCKS